MSYAKPVAIVTILAGAFVAGYKVADWRADAAKLVVAEQAAKDLQDMTVARDQLAKVLQESNDKYEANLRKKQDETNRLRDGTASGPIGLRIAATCGELRLASQSTSGIRLDTGNPAELSPTARRAYFALRDGIDRASAQLEACQDQLKQRVPQ